MILKEELWGDIPLLHMVNEQNRDEEVPVAVFHHGFMSAKEHNLHFAVNLAKQGIRVILPDAQFHGARSENLDEIGLRLRFWDTVLNSIEELDIIRETLKEQKLLSTAKIGVSGTSMGGIISCGALAAYDWIDAAAVMMGAPAFVERATEQIENWEKEGFEIPTPEDEKRQLFEKLAAHDITQHPSLLNKRPLHFWHGEQDPVVPFRPTWAFYESIRGDYSDVPERLSFTADPKAAHVVSRPAMLEAMGWLARHLNA